MAPSAALVPAGQETIAAYAAIGLGLGTFGFTFGVLPQFKEIIKEGTPWNTMYPVLVSTGVKTVSPSQVGLWCVVATHPLTCERAHACTHSRTVAATWVLDH